MASRRKRGPVAFRPRLLAGLALSIMTEVYVAIGRCRQFGEVPNQQCLLWVDCCPSRAYHANGSYSMQSRSQTTIFHNRSLTGSYCAHSRHSNCLKNQNAKGGSRPLAAVNQTLREIAGSPTMKLPLPLSDNRPSYRCQYPAPVGRSRCQNHAAHPDNFRPLFAF